MQYVNTASLVLVQNQCSASHSLWKHFRKLHVSTQPFSHWVNKHGDTSQVALIVKKKITRQCRRPQRRERCGFYPWVGKSPWRRAWQPTPVFLPGESHGQRSLVGYRPWSHKELDMLKGLSMARIGMNNKLPYMSQSTYLKESSHVKESLLYNIT